MITTGIFYQNQTETESTSVKSSTTQVDSLKALRTFFESDTDSSTDKLGLSDSVEISAQALTVLKEYVSANGTTDDDPYSQYIKDSAREQFFLLNNGVSNSTEDTDSALDELTDAISAYSAKQIAEVRQQIMESNRQMSDDFISTAARYGVQSLL